jgi:hypothetical protein
MEHILYGTHSTLFTLSYDTALYMLTLYYYDRTKLHQVPVRNDAVVNIHTCIHIYMHTQSLK